MSADRLEIESLVARFDDAVNRRDASEFAALWSPDAIWEIGEPRSLRIEGATTIVQAWQEMIAGTVWLFRGSFAGVVTLQGDRATGRWPCVEAGTFAATADTPATGYDNRALYEDAYVRTADGWRFRHRRYLYLWLSSERLPGSAVALGPELAGDAS